ncbi:MAG: carboxypeptidase Q [Limisphaerales bacterium]|jgi:carboxypeptidase Q|tara:strand:+ start:3503 stop:4867 length:1365 start_codon:yes stop_codon:yes gene_type:complete
MNWKRTLLFIPLGFGVAYGFAAGSEPVDYRPEAQRLTQAATNSLFGFSRLATMCDTFGPRFTGSKNLEEAIDWCLAEMKKDGFLNVRGEEVTVPRWVRGSESIELLSPRRRELPMLGLGGSVGTPPEGIMAEVLVVTGFDDLKNHAAEAKGKIVLFNVPFTEYRETVIVRTQGAIHAARAEAVASLIRSVGPFSMQTPHTGGMSYADGVKKIPHAALSLEDANMLSRMQARGEPLRVRLKMEARTLADGISHNVVAEIPGTEKPEEIVIVSGHIDSWDVGQGAMDDGGGCLAAWEAARLMLKLGLRPKRTVRVVLWTNEENGLRGATSYAKRHEAALAKHTLAIESDAGVFRPTGFGFLGSGRGMEIIRGVAKLLDPIGSGSIAKGCRGADVLKLVRGGVPVMHLEVEREKYFWFHHTDADTIDKLDPAEFNRCVAAMAVMAYVIADLPETLPR